LARRPECREQVLRLLQRRYQGYDKSAMILLESTLVDAAGRMRLEEAAPLLVDRLHEDDVDVGDACERALRRMGSDAVVRTIAEQWDDAAIDFRGWAAGVLERIPCDAAFAHCREWFTPEEDVEADDFDITLALANALLGQFDTEAVPLIHPTLNWSNDDLEMPDLQERLAAAATIMGVAFPERDAWLSAAEAARREGLSEYRLRARDFWARSRPINRRSDDDFDGDDDLDGDEDFDDDPDADVGSNFVAADDERPLPNYAPPMTPIRRDKPAVGRNAPCPCGSGRKYKKCCLAKDKRDGDARETGFA
jgi:hypothetical protein